MGNKLIRKRKKRKRDHEGIKNNKTFIQIVTSDLIGLACHQGIRRETFSSIDLISLERETETIK